MLRTVSPVFAAVRSSCRGMSHAGISHVVGHEDAKKARREGQGGEGPVGEAKLLGFWLGGSERFGAVRWIFLIKRLGLLMIDQLVS